MYFLLAEEVVGRDTSSWVTVAAKRAVRALVPVRGQHPRRAVVLPASLSGCKDLRARASNGGERRQTYIRNGNRFVCPLEECRLGVPCGGQRVTASRLRYILTPAALRPTPTDDPLHAYCAIPLIESTVASPTDKRGAAIGMRRTERTWTSRPTDARTRALPPPSRAAAQRRRRDEGHA